MDTDVDVEVECSARPLALRTIRDLFEEQEQRFSRFRPTSVLSGLNRGEPVVDATFSEVCRLALECWRTTGGLFNPLILGALEAAGYDRTFGSLTGGEPRHTLVPTPDEALVITGDTVRLAAGKLDLGGIVKGWTVGRAVALLATECDAVLVNGGGDISCTGTPDGEGWELAIASPKGATLWSGEITGALATSTTMKRRWRTDGGAEAHHLIDPRTGLPSESEFVQVSARAAHTWEAEVWAKAALIGGRTTIANAGAHGVSLLSVTGDGAVEAWGNWPYLSRPER